MHHGTIVEKGTHDDLLKSKESRYASMWNRQAKAEKAAEDARVAARKAEKLMRKANIGLGGHSDSSQPGQDGRTTPGNDDGSSSSSDESSTRTRKRPSEE